MSSPGGAGRVAVDGDRALHVGVVHAQPPMDHEGVVQLFAPIAGDHLQGRRPHLESSQRKRRLQGQIDLREVAAGHFAAV